MTAVDGPGRLDRILVTTGQAMRAADRRITTTRAGASRVDFVDPAPGPEVARLRGMVAALEAECAALTHALATVSHEYQAGDFGGVTASGEPACNGIDIYDELCMLHPGHRVHRTPGRVRAELGQP